MEIASRMAFRAKGTTAPNPNVGAIIVKDGKILSRGWTGKNGRPHAEFNAIKRIKNKKKLNGATLYCTLEPCSHNGKTGPCTELILKYGFKNVFISSVDKNKIVGQLNRIIREKASPSSGTFNNWRNQVRDSLSIGLESNGTGKIKLPRDFAEDNGKPGDTVMAKAIFTPRPIYDKDAKTGRWSVWYIDVLENMTNKKFAKTVSSLVFASPMILTAIGLYNIYRILY